MAIRAKPVRRNTAGHLTCPAEPDGAVCPDHARASLNESRTEGCPDQPRIAHRAFTRSPPPPRNRRPIAARIGLDGLIALYQTGLIKHLPEPPLPLFDA